MALVAFAPGKQTSAETSIVTDLSRFGVRMGKTAFTLYISKLNLKLNIEHIFMNLLTICMSAFVSVCSSIVRISIDFIFLIFIFILHNLHMLPLQVYVVSNFSKQMVCMFIFWILSFTEQIFLRSPFY